MRSVLLYVCAAAVSFAAPVITIRPSVGPNDSSASFDAYVANALSGLQTCVGATCTVGGSLSATPTAFNQTNSFALGDMIRTPYSSWRGTAPAPTPGAFAGEFGNLAFWAVSVIDTTGTFSLHDLGVDQSSLPSGYFNFSDTYAGRDYGFDRIGINFGVDGAMGGGDDIVYNSGDGGALINALFFVGIGFGFDGLLDFNGDPWPGPSDQEKINQLLAGAASLLGEGIRTCYNIGATQSCADVTIGAIQSDPGDPSPVPEPASSALVAAGLAGLCWARRRRSRS